ncbi:hypothetical protein [Rhodococcus sp. SORGH_AS_0303]|uniref:hypothetical protein n=1 Tax=Rhodococcus sp. SORGH_AS_0303 TaxID=3041753 RepID=UPI00278065E5|nr:hypothetical protein [Rhodococcus sp. SORGH_AS_0303]MDQ1200486.1 hypothetical protein [Rhodococcus sp. SORGH_AS_0303]
MTIDDAQQRVQVQELSGALLKLGSKHGDTATLLTRLFQVIADEAVRTPRFATAVTAALAVTAGSGGGGESDGPVVPKPQKRQRATPAKKVGRQPGMFDPFEVLKVSGEEELFEKLSQLTVDQLRDIIAEQEIDTRKEAARKRSAGPIVVWTVERVKALASKGSVFR